MRRVRGHIRDLGGCTLGHEDVPQGSTLGSPHQVDEALALKRHACVELALGGCFDDIHAFERRREIFGHAAHHIAGELEISITLRVFARQVAHQWQRPRFGDRTRIEQCLFGQGFVRGGHFVEQLLARQHRQQFALDWLTTDNHVQCGLDPERTRQALRTAGTRQQAQLDLGQRHATPRRGNTVMTTQGQFQPAAHADRVNGGNDRFARIFNRQNDAQQVGFLQGRGAAKLLDVGAARERFARAGDDNRFHGPIGIGLGQTIGECQSCGIAQSIDGWVIERQYGDVAMHFVVSGHACIPRK